MNADQSEGTEIIPVLFEEMDGVWLHIQDEHHKTLTDAVWYEKIAVITLILCITSIGFFPSFFSDLIRSSLTAMTNW